MIVCFKSHIKLRWYLILVVLLKSSTTFLKLVLYILAFYMLFLKYETLYNNIIRFVFFDIII